MAKSIRSIKSDLCDDETLGNLSRDARYLFIGLITRADDHGRFRAHPALVRSRVLPYDDVSNEDVAEWLRELADSGRIQTYHVEGQTYGVFINWDKHQRIDNAAKSELPEPPATASVDASEIDTTYIEPNPGSPQSADVRRNLPQSAAGKDRKGKEGIGEEILSSSKLDGEPPQNVLTVFEAWKDSTGKAKAKLDPKRRKLIQTALKDYPVEDVADAVRGWRHSSHHRGENEQHTAYNELHVLLGDAARIEKFRDLERNGAPPTTGGTRMDQHMRNLALVVGSES